MDNGDTKANLYIIAADKTTCRHSLMPRVEEMATIIGVRIIAPTVCDTKVHTKQANTEKTTTAVQAGSITCCNACDTGSAIICNKDWEMKSFTIQIL